jgi:hypothetical protein
MKKILLTFIAAILFCGAYAQGEYEMKVNVEIWDGQDNNSGKCNNYYELRLAFEGQPQDWWWKNGVPIIPKQWKEYMPMVWQNLNPIGGGHKFYEHKISFPNNKIPKTIFTYGSRQWKNWFECEGYSGYNSFGIGANYKNCYNALYQGKIDDWGSKITVQIYPKKIDLVSNTNIIPVDEKIKIEATKGFLNTIYKWQYKLGINGQWTNFPPAQQTGETVNVSAKDLLGADAENNIAQNIYVRVSYGCFGQDKFSNALIFNTLLSSPHITSVTPVPYKCFGENNGYVKIKFDRALKPNEFLNIFIQDKNDPNNLEQIFNLQNLPADNTIISSPILKPGDFTIKVSGKYNGLQTYADGPGHTANTNFVSPLPVTFSANKTNDVYCFGGNDGTITINAAGGTPNYLLGYKKQWQADYVWVNFNQPNKHILSNLDTGTYQLRVKDANACVELSQGKEVIRTVIITQPEKPLKIDFLEITDPLQFGSTDGSVKVILAGGTPKPDQSYNIGWQNLNNDILNNYINNIVPTGYQTFLQDVGAGKYILTATDDNYAKAANNSKKGCLIKDTFHVKDPLPLTADIEEQHYISCKEDKDGQLVAHASGGIKFKIGLPYHYQWFKIVNGVNIDINQSDSIATGLAAGEYFVKITDFNNIIKESAIYNLKEPDVLHVEVVPTPVSCSGGNDGSAKAIVSGGTQPYQYEWSTTETTALISNLTEGTYWAYIKDAHQCETQGQAKIVAPNPIKVDPTIKHPTCYQACDGFINLDVSGGNAPYTYLWSNGAITKDIANGCAGNYTLTITDASNCSRVLQFSLINPLPIIDLGQDRTLCQGQNYEADASIAEPGATYQWGSNTGFVANTPKVLLSNEGTYWVAVDNGKGCIGKDTILIHRKNVDIAAEFISSTQAFKDEPVMFINLSLPSPDSISWIVPNNPNIQVLSNNQNIAELKFTSTGTYSISLKSYKGGCEKIFTKKIIVLEPQPFDDLGQVQEPFIKTFTIAPNPNNGQFIVKVTLKEQAKIRLRMYNVLTNVQVSDRQESGSSQYTLPYNVNAPAGTYFLLLETPKGNIMYKIIIN